MTKYLLATLAAAASVAGAGAAFAQALPEAKIAVVDSDRIFRDCTACKAANTQLQAQSTQLRSQAQSLSAPLQTEEQSLRTAVTAAKGNPDAALQARITAFETKRNAAQQQIGTQQQTLERNVAYVRQQIGQKLGPIISQVAQQRGATVAMDKGSVFFAAAPVEITDAVLAQLNSQLPSVSTTAPAQAAPAAPAPARPQGR
jgi:outer membrane protein